MRNCIFRANFADVAGGAVECGAATAPSFIDCQFINNQAGYGGAIDCGTIATPHFERCMFSDNVAPGEYGAGGAIYCIYTAIPTLEECIFIANSAAVVGGALALYSESHAILRHCTFYANGAPLGGAIYTALLSLPQLDNCIIAFSTQGAGVDSEDIPGANLRCCDLYGNAGGDWVGPIADQAGIHGNISADPLFCDAPNLDLRLHVDSPCLPGFNPECGLIGALPIGCPDTGTGDEMPAAGMVLTVTPNPSPGTVTLSYETDASILGMPVVLAVHDAAGRLVRTLARHDAASGPVRVTWDARDESGRRVSPGIYFARLTAGSLRVVRSAILLQ